MKCILFFHYLQPNAEILGKLNWPPYLPSTSFPISFHMTSFLVIVCKRPSLQAALNDNK